MTIRTFLILSALLAFSVPSAALTILTDYVEIPDEPLGFHDPSTQVARRAAFERACEIWGAQLAGDVTVIVRAFYADDEFFGGGGVVLAVGKPTSASANLSGLPFSETLYYAALASQLTGISLPATVGDAAGFHLQVVSNDKFNVDLPIWWYELNNPAQSGNASFVSFAMHELGHGLGMYDLVQVVPDSVNPGAWVNTLIEPVPDEPAVLPIGDIFSRFLTRTPAGGGTDDKDFFDMTNAERFAAINSNEVYFTGAHVKAAAEFAPPPSAPLASFKGEIQMFSPSVPEDVGAALSHWAVGHAGSLLMKPVIPPGVELGDIDATRELMRDLGWGLNPPPASGSLAIVFVNFSFTGEEFGTQALPVNTLSEAVNLVMSGGTINIEPGTSGENLTINKAMTINAIEGVVSVGSP